MYKVHWHVLMTHGPLSMFGGSFLFQFLNVFAYHACFEMAANVLLLVGTLTLIPTALTGWRTWKSKYKGAQSLIFRRKLTLTYILLGISIPLTLWRVGHIGLTVFVPNGAEHWLYVGGNVLLMLLSSAEGFYGGQLNHR